MGELVKGDDGLPVEDVGPWVKDKHDRLCRYIDISSATRRKYVGPRKGGATYIDLFCGAGRSQVRKSGEFIDGGCVSAWKQSVKSNSPFSAVYIADADEERRAYSEARLRALGAPVRVISGDALTASRWARTSLSRYSLHFAFIDPFNLGAFDFEIIKNLSAFQRMDMLVHVSKQDLQRNVGFNVSKQQRAFDVFAPGWREKVNLKQPFKAIRRDVFEYWRKLVKETGSGVTASVQMELITGPKNIHLYWLLLLARHELAHKFWETAIASDQGSLF